MSCIYDTIYIIIIFICLFYTKKVLYNYVHNVGNIYVYYMDILCTYYIYMCTYIYTLKSPVRPHPKLLPGLKLIFLLFLCINSYLFFFLCINA